MTDDAADDDDERLKSVRAVWLSMRDEEPPDQAFFVGDIVNRGFDEEYHRARHILAPLQHAFEPILGNHELQRASVADFEREIDRARPDGVARLRVRRQGGGYSFLVLKLK